MTHNRVQKGPTFKNSRHLMKQGLRAENLLIKTKTVGFYFFPDSFWNFSYEILLILLHKKSYKTQNGQSEKLPFNYEKSFFAKY